MTTPSKGERRFKQWKNKSTGGGGIGETGTPRRRGPKRSKGREKGKRGGLRPDERGV